MSEEHSKEVKDEHPYLQKKSGCMTAIFQIFDGCHNHNRKKLTSGQSHLNNESLGEQATTFSDTATEKNSSKSGNKQRTLSDSLGASFSSSMCSSSNPLSIERATLSEHSMTISHEINNSDVNCKLHCHAHCSRDSIEFRDIVKDSIYGDQRSSFKSTTREEIVDHVPTHRHSLEPFQLSQSRNATHVDGVGGKARMLTGNESPRIQGKTKNAREFLRSSTEGRSGSFNSALPDIHRFSYDGRDMSCSVSGGTCKSPMKLRILPRLSLDGRECTIRSSNYNLNTDLILEDLKMSSIDQEVSYHRNSNIQQEFRNYEQYPSVVTKLMGLEEIPNSRSAVHGQMHQMESHAGEALDLSDGNSSQKYKETKQHQSSQSKRSSLRGCISPPQRNSEVMKPNLSSRSHIETTSSWRQDSGRSPKSRAFCIQDVHAGSALDCSDGELSKKFQESKQNQKSRSPRGSLSGQISPQQQNSEFTKPILNSGLQIKYAPSKQKDCGCSPWRAAFDSQDEQAVATTSLSVYGEIEKKFEELDFQQSYKDLRALKHVLKAIQVRELSEIEKADASDHVSHKNYDIHNQRFDQNLNMENRSVSQNFGLISSPVRTKKKGDLQPTKEIGRSQFVDRSITRTPTVETFNRSLDLGKLRINNSVDSKYALVNYKTHEGPSPKLGLRESGTKILSPVDKKTNARNEAYGSRKHQVRSMQDSFKPETSSRDNAGSLRGTSKSLNPRMQRRKFELEKRCYLPILPSGSNKSSTQPIDKKAELTPSGKKQKPKSVNLKKYNCQPRLLCIETGNFSCGGDVISIRSHGNISSTSVIQVISAEQNSEMRDTSVRKGCQSPHRKAVDDVVLSLEQTRSLSSSSKDGSSSKFITVASEHSSPVSVLNASLYGDDLPPSPVKKISNSIQDDAVPSNDETQLHNVISGKDKQSVKDTECSFNKKQLNFTSRINDKKLENKEHLIQNFGELSSSNYRSTLDHNGSLFEDDTNPDHRYIYEILLASGLLLDDGDISSSSVLSQIHSSPHLLNPNLFMALEDMCLPKLESTSENLVHSKPNKEKLHRKLVFETVNEILIQRMEMEAEPWVQLNNLVGLIPSRRRLMRDMCLEISWLQADASNKSIIENHVISGLGRWMDCRKEVSSVVLDIERMIFKDMIDEIVRH